ncbi:MAG: O-antigen ligase family protein [Candidatus Omnitrophota bacterium]
MGILVILLHSLVDFNLHITANAFYFTVLLSLAVAISSNIDNIDKKFIFKIVGAIIFIGFFIALFGILHKLSGSEKIYWVLDKDGEHFGPYVNYDHYAGYIGMCASLAIASFMARVRFSSFFSIKDKRDKLMWFSSKEASQTIRQFICAVVMVGSLFYSSSRGGILSFIIAILLFFFFITVRTRKGRRGRLLFFFILILLLSSVIVFWLGPDYTIGKFKNLNQVARSIIHEPSILSERRPQIWSDSVKIAKDFPVTGSGFGTFSSIFPKYRTHKWGGDFLRYTHCDYLQLALETGIIGVVFIIGFLTYFIRLYVSALRKLR